VSDPLATALINTDLLIMVDSLIMLAISPKDWEIHELPGTAEEEDKRAQSKLHNEEIYN
jgi:hypothetical protein